MFTVNRLIVCCRAGKFGIFLWNKTKDSAILSQTEALAVGGKSERPTLITLATSFCLL